MTDKIEWGGTPGPWKAEPADMFGDHNIIPCDYTDTRLAVAAVVSNLRFAVEVAANARAIAEVPAMVQALMDALEWIEGCGAQAGLNDICDQLEAILARIEKPEELK